MRARIWPLFLLLFLVPVHTPAQEDRFLKRLQGDWEGNGQAFGGAARLRIKWEWVLDNKFLRLSLRSEMSAANGATRIFEGQAYYRPDGADKYTAHWFDSRGVTFPIKAQLEGNTLVASWGTPETEEGKSTYQLLDDTTLEVVDSVKQKDGTFREFGRAKLKRAQNVRAEPGPRAKPNVLYYRHGGAQPRLTSGGGAATVLRSRSALNHQ